MNRVVLKTVIAVVVLGIGLCGVALQSQTAKPAPAKPTVEKPPAYLDAESGGADFKVQGEYSGEVEAEGGKAKLGCQVIALGNRKFQAVFLGGGLPGDGWDGKTRIEVDGNREENDSGLTDFPQGKAGYHATHKDDHLDGQNDKGKVFNLKKVMRKSPAEGAKPPEGATVLFDGADISAWQGAHVDERKLLQAGTSTKKKYQSFTMHVEFILPFKPLGRDQDRGNSGIYIQDRYELQVLDTFGHKPEFNGCASMYRQREPAINMCYPPLSWQTYDIDFTAAKFDGSGKKTNNAVVSVKHNGVVVHDKYELTDKTGAGQKEGPAAGPIQLQGHGNPVFFRNVWIIEKP